MPQTQQKGANALQYMHNINLTDVITKVQFKVKFHNNTPATSLTRVMKYLPARVRNKVILNPIINY